MEHFHWAAWFWLMGIIHCKAWANSIVIFQQIFSKSSSRGWGIFLFKSSNSIKKIILFLCFKSGSLVCSLISGKRFWKPNRFSPLRFPIYNIKPSFFIILDSKSPIKSLFLWVAEKKSLLSKILKIGKYQKK